MKKQYRLIILVSAGCGILLLSSCSKKQDTLDRAPTSETSAEATDQTESVNPVEPAIIASVEDTDQTESVNPAEPAIIASLEDTDQAEPVNPPVNPIEPAIITSTEIASKSDLAKTPVVLESDTAKGLAEIISSNKNVVIDFYGDWCSPCKYMAPIINELAHEHPDITFVKTDIDKLDTALSPFKLAGKDIDISTVPTFYLFKNGSFANVLHGGMQKAAFLEKLQAAFK